MTPSGIDTLIVINAEQCVPSHVVGAKARSLQQIMAFGLPVPPALLLPTGFFQPWFALVRRLPSWHAWLAGPPEQWPALCAAIRSDALALPFSDRQSMVVEQLLERLAGFGPGARFAVRSSSPDEDTAGASFAGLYATELGLEAAAVAAAIRRCFAACLDYRVLAYKAARGIACDRPSMALIVQEQIDSEVAGVGFSINPLTNDFDEAVVDANWGLGESVVSGIATPDHFILNKANGAVVARPWLDVIRWLASVKRRGQIRPM